jgi:hypothetical protein
VAIDVQGLLSEARGSVGLGFAVQESLGIALLNRIATGKPYELQVQQGLVEGASRVLIMGHNQDVDIATVPEDIWEGGGAYPFQTSAQSLEILSSAAADTAAGTGAQSVRVSGLDASWTEQSEVVVLNGVTPVPLALQFFRVNACECVTAGSGLSNAGTITLRVAGAGASQAVIEIGDGRAHQAIYTVPAGKTLFFISREVATLRQAVPVGCEINIFVRNGSASQPWIARNIFGTTSDGTSSYVKELPFLSVGQRNDFRVTVVGVTANNVALSVTIEAFLINN